MKLPFRKQKSAATGRRSPRAVQYQEAFSYYHSNSRRAPVIERHPEVKQLQQKTRRRSLQAVFVVLVVVVAIMKVLYVSADPVIKVEGTGGALFEYRALSVYETVAKASISETILNRNKLFIDTTGIRAQLLERLPEVSDVEVVLPLINNRPQLKLYAHPPGMIIQSGATRFVTTYSGRVVGILEPGAQYPELLTVLDESGTSYQIGELALSSGAVAFVRELDHQLAAKGMAEVSYVLPAKGVNELNARQNGSAYFMRFDMSGDALTQAGTLLASIEYLQGRSETPQAYIDARTTGRAYYK